MTVCELCGEESRGRYLCEKHAVALAKRLADLPTLYGELVQCLVPRGHGWGEIVSTRRAAGPRSPLDEGVLDEMNSSNMAAVVHSWRVDVQRVRWPQHTPPPPASLDANCRWLAMELEWIVDHYPAAGDLAREVHELETQARSIVGDPAPRPQRLGTCVAITAEGVVCGAVISRLPGQTRLACRWCGYIYESAQDWLLLQHFQPSEALSPLESNPGVR